MIQMPKTRYNSLNQGVTSLTRQQYTESLLVSLCCLTTTQSSPITLRLDMIAMEVQYLNNLKQTKKKTLTWVVSCYDHVQCLLRPSSSSCDPVTWPWHMYCVFSVSLIMIHRVTFLNLCCPFTKCTFFMNIYHHHQFQGFLLAYWGISLFL